MANFTLNINGQVDDLYVPIRYIITEETDCATINKTIPLGVLESSNEPSIIFLLQSWGRGFGWKTIKIKNLTYSNSTDFYLEDGGVQIPEAGATVYDIDITGIALSSPITDFVLKFDNLDLTQNETINFSMAVEDLNNFLGSYYPVTISLQRIKCPAPPVANYVAFITADTDCTTTCDITIACPDEEQRRVVISFTGTPGYQTVDLSLSPVDEIITTPTVYQLAITADRSIGTAFTSNILVEIFPDATFPIALDSYILTRQHNSTLC